MKKAIIFNFMLFILILAVFSNASLVTAKSPTPLASEYDIQLSYFSPYNSEYKLKDTLITDKSVDLMFLSLLRDSTKLDLGKSVWESTFSTITLSNAYSLTLGNATWETASSDGMTVNTNPTSNAPETLLTFKATTNASAVGQYAQSFMYFSYDGNGDGDYSDTADKSYLPHDENIYLLVNNEMTTSSTDASTYSTIQIAFETTTSSDYVITIKYWYTSGDSGWDFSGSNGAQLDFYDCSGDPIVTVLPLAEILDADSESVNIIGTDYYKQYLYCDEASKYVQNEVKNMAYFTSMPSFTDDIDGDNDWDFDGSDEYFTGIDQTDYLFTVVTQAATDTYDNEQELLADYDGSLTTIVPARYLYFTGAVAMYPSTYAWDSDFVEAGKYLTTETLTFDTREINDLDTLSNVLSVSTWKFNVTLEDSVCWDTDHYENNLVSFTVEGIDQTESFRSAWSVTADDSEVQYDISDPSTTTGDLDSITLSYYTSQDMGKQETTSLVGGGISTSSSSSNSTIGWLLIGGLVVATIVYIKTRD